MTFEEIREILEEKSDKYEVLPQEGYGLVEFRTDYFDRNILTEFDFDGTPEGFVKEFVKAAQNYDIDTQEARDIFLDIAKALKRGVTGSPLLTEFGAAFIQKPLDEGLTKSEVLDLFDMLKGVSAIPFEVQSEDAVAMGFVNRTDAEMMDYDLKPLEVFVREIISDTANENETGQYEFHYDGSNVVDVYIGY